MSEAPTVLIPRKHQSAPREDEVDRAIRTSAEEIAKGDYIPEMDDMDEREALGSKLGIALGLGSGGVAVGQKPTLEEFRSTHEMNELARHPRVQEALEKLAQQRESAVNPEQLLEYEMASHELMCQQQQQYQWDGQRRWQGKENEEMRHGQLLTPWQFMERLEKVIGRERVRLGERFAPSLQNPKTGRIGLYVANPNYKGGYKPPVYVADKVQEMREEAWAILKKAKQLRALHQDTQADQKFNDAANLVQAATEMMMGNMVEAQTQEPPQLRVGTLQAPLGTEWMIMDFDEFDVPTQAKYLGWRTALLTMIRCGAITEAEAHKAFPVGSGPAADWYMEQLYDERQQRLGAAK